MSNFEVRKTPSVSVCIGTYNQAQYLEECIQSILAQTYPVQGIWVSDDASTDRTADVMLRICEQHPTVTYYRQPVNIGIAENLSWVLSQPLTEFIARIDSDDRLESTFIATLLDLMQKYPQAGFAHGDVFEMDARGIRTRVRRLHRSAVYESPEETLWNNAQGYRVAANCILYRAASLSQANYYHPNASWGFAEDWDLCLRIAILGWGNVYAPTPLANYRVWNDSEQVRFRRRVLEIQGVISVYRGTLQPEYIKRGWNIGVLKMNMRRRAIAYADALDSPLFSVVEREVYKARLHDLGASLSLSLAISLADAGLNPLFRMMRKTRIRVKDYTKTALRSIEALRRKARTTLRN